MSTNLPPNIDPGTAKPMWDTIFLGLTAVGTILVAVLAIWGDWIRYKLLPAKLTIELHNVVGDLTLITRPFINPAPPPSRVYFYHLKVVNKRRWVSPQNCRVLLKAISKRGPNGIFYPVSMSVPLQFVWAPSEITPPVITIEKEQILDLGMAVEGTGTFVPRLYSVSHNFAGNVGAGEAVRYSLEIVSSSFVSKKYQVIEVAYDGKWSDDRNEMQAHLRIREIAEP